LSGCATTPKHSCVNTIPAAALHGCDTSALAAPTPEGSRASDVVLDDIAIINALSECRAAHQSLINHVRIACPDQN